MKRTREKKQPDKSSRKLHKGRRDRRIVSVCKLLKICPLQIVFSTVAGRRWTEQLTSQTTVTGLFTMSNKMSLKTAPRKSGVAGYAVMKMSL